MRNQLTELSVPPRIQPRRRWSAPSCPPCPPAYPPFISSSLSSSSRSCFSATSCTSEAPLIGLKWSIFHLIRLLDGVCTFPPAGVNKKQLQRNSFDETHLWNPPANEGMTHFMIEFVWFFFFSDCKLFFEFFWIVVEDCFNAADCFNLIVKLFEYECWV